MTTALAKQFIHCIARDTYLKDISLKERNDLHWLLDHDGESAYRAKIILLKHEGYNVPEIRRITNHHDNNIRKWIHRFNDYGLDGIISRKHTHTPQKITDDIEQQIVDIACTDPKRYNLKFSTWSLRVLAGFIMNEMKLIDTISHTEIRSILLKHGIEWRHSKTVLIGKSRDPEYDLKKVYR